MKQNTLSKLLLLSLLLNEVSYFGPGARKELPGVVNRLGFKKALVVTPSSGCRILKYDETERD